MIQKYYSPLIALFLSVGLAWLVYLLHPILLPFFIGALFAYLGDPLVTRLQDWHCPRSLAAALVFLLILALVFLVCILLIPALQKQSALLVEKIPLVINIVQTQAIPWLNAQTAHLQLQIPTLDPQSVQTFAQAHWQDAGKVLDSTWKIVSTSSATVLTFIMNLLLIPVVTFYLLRDWPNLLRHLNTFLPRNQRATLLPLFQQCDEVLSAFFRGQLMVMLILGIIYAVGLSFAGLQVAILIGLIAGLLSIVPYLGFTVGLISALIAALIQFHDVTHLYTVLSIFIIGNVLEGMVLTPWLIGDKIGLHPVAVIFSILAGGQLFGFTGILLALPVAAVLMVLLRHIKVHYTHAHS